MRINVKTKNLELGDSLRDYVERKTSRLDRYLDDIVEAKVELTSQNTRTPEDSQVAQITLRNEHGVVLRTEERSSDVRTSLDAALDKMSRRIKKYKGKHWGSHTRRPTPPAVPADEEEAGDHVVRTKHFRTRPMDVNEAIEQMELLGHDFFVFFNVATNGFSVVYKRRDEGYGLLLPEIS